MEVLVELSGILEALEDIVPVDEAFGPAINGILEAELVLLGLEAKLTLIQHGVQLFEDDRDQLGALVPDVSQSQVRLRQVVRREELVWPEPEFHVVDQLLHPPAVAKLIGGVVALDASLEPARSQDRGDILKGFNSRLRIEATLSELVVGLKNLLQRGHGIHDGIPLLLELVFLFLSEPHLALVEPLHFVYEYLVPLQLQVLVLLHRLGDGTRQAVTLLGLAANIVPEGVDVPEDVVLGLLLATLGL